MTKRKRMILIAGVAALIVCTGVLLNVTHVWKNNSYRLLAAKHLHLSSGQKELFWFDVVHSNNPDDVMFPLLEEEFAAFRPDLVLVEGGADGFQGTREEAIAEGENSFGALLAKEAGIPVEDIEPPFEAQIAYLRERYSPDEVFAMYTLRQIGSLESLPEDVELDFEAFLLDQIGSLGEKGLDYPGSTAAEALDTLNRYLPQPMDRDNWMSLKVYRVYAIEDNVIHQAYEDVFAYRNIYLVELIAQKQQEYDRIFVVMGGQHLLDTQAELEALYR